MGDIAEIKRGYVDPPSVKVHHQGKEVIALGVSMAKGGDIIRSQTYTAFMPLTAVALIYLSVVMLFSWMLGKLERKLKNNE